MFDSDTTRELASIEIISLLFLGLLFIFLLWRGPIVQRARLAARDGDVAAYRAAERRGRKEMELRSFPKPSSHQVDEVEKARLVARQAMEGAERTRERADRLTLEMWAAIALFVLSLIPVLIALIYVRGVFSQHPQTSMTVPVLEALARDGLRDLKTLVEFLRPPILPNGYGPTIPAPVSGGTVQPTGWAWAGLVAAVGAVVGVLCLIVGNTAVRAGGGVLLLASSAGLGGLSVFEKGSLFKFEGGHVDLFRGQLPGSQPPVESMIVINVLPGTGQSPQVVSATNVELLCKSENGFLEVGTFKSGESDKLEDKDNDAVDRLIEKIDALDKDKTLMALFLIGYADKTHLNPKTEGLYDSNLALAQKRAAWVHRKLKEKAAATDRTDTRIATLSAVVVLGSPPTYVGPDEKDAKLLEGKLAEDRRVMACILVQSMQQK